MTTENITEATAPNPAGETARKSVWLRGLYMLITAFLIGAAQSVLFLLAVIQFILMLLDSKKPNAQIADFGDVIGKWLASAAKFQTGRSEDKPWPLGPLT